MRRFNKILILVLLAAVAAIVASLLHLHREERSAARDSEEDAKFLEAIAPPRGIGAPVEATAALTPPGVPSASQTQAPRAPVAVPVEMPRAHPAPTGPAPDQVARPLKEMAHAAPPAQGSEPAPAPPARLAVHRVGAGDTLYKLAKKYYGDASRWNLIQEANPALLGSTPKALKLGSELVIPVAPQVAR